VDLSSPNRRRSGTGLTAGVLLQKEIPNEVEVEKRAILRNIKGWSEFLMCSKSKYFWKIVLAEFRSRELLSRKLKIFISVRMIELAGGLDHLRLKEYPWIAVSLTITILNRLEKPVLLFAISHFVA